MKALSFHGPHCGRDWTRVVCDDEDYVHFFKRGDWKYAILETEDGWYHVPFVETQELLGPYTYDQALTIARLFE